MGRPAASWRTQRKQRPRSAEKALAYCLAARTLVRSGGRYRLSTIPSERHRRCHDPPVSTSLMRNQHFINPKRMTSAHRKALEALEAVGDGDDVMRLAAVVVAPERRKIRPEEFRLSKAYPC